MRRRLQEALGSALRRRDAAAATALRSALGAIDNAESVPATGVHGPKLGAGAADVRRRELSRAELLSILSAEVNERLSAALTYEGAGRHDDAQRLRAEAAVIEPYVAG
jgi:hypothetical protein